MELLPELEAIGKKKQGTEKGTGFRATDEAAKLAGSTKNAVNTAKNVKKKDEAAFKDMKDGKKSVAQAKRDMQEKKEVDVWADAMNTLKIKSKVFIKAIDLFLETAGAEDQEPNWLENVQIISADLEDLVISLK